MNLRRSEIRARNRARTALLCLAALFIGAALLEPCDGHSCARGATFTTR